MPKTYEPLRRSNRKLASRSSSLLNSREPGSSIWFAVRRRRLERSSRPIRSAPRRSQPPLEIMRTVPPGPPGWRMKMFAAVPRRRP